MEVSELRFGNWLKTKKHSIPFVVKSYMAESCFGGGNHNNDYDDFDPDINSVEPIPLTEEWILKFGGKHNIGWVVGSIELEEDGGEFYYQLDSGRLKINYVHQLQNLHFALSNTELLISS